MNFVCLCYICQTTLNCFNYTSKGSSSEVKCMYMWYVICPNSEIKFIMEVMWNQKQSVLGFDFLWSDVLLLHQQQKVTFNQ